MGSTKITTRSIMKKLTVVFLHPHFLKPSGASRVVLEQASRLQKLGFYCPIVTTKADPRIVSQYSNLDIRCISRHFTGQFIFWLLIPLFFGKLIPNVNRVRPDYIYCHSLAIYWGFLYKIFYPEIKVILYFHDLGFPYFDSDHEANSLIAPYPYLIKIVSPFYSYLHKLIIAKANWIVANSRTTSKFIFENYHRKPDVIVTPGVNLKLFRPSQTKKNYIITVGRLEQIKNYSTVIMAFADYVKSSRSDSKLYVAGDGPQKKYLQNLAKQQAIDSSVIFLGNQTPETLARLYSQARLGIFMSPYESFGLSALECLACGTPLIGVNKNGIKEITSNLGNKYMIDNDPIKLSRKISQLIDHGQSSDKVRKAALPYSWDIQIGHLALWLKNLS
jgi:glycosyltransferase involved in cell wall biosynthesis